MSENILKKRAMLIALTLIILVSLCFNGCVSLFSMEKAILNAEELVPAEDTVIVFNNLIEPYRFTQLYKMLVRKLNSNSEFEVERLLCIHGSKCYIAASKHNNKGRQLLIIDADVNGKGYEVIGEHNLEDNHICTAKCFGDAASLHFFGDDVYYSRLDAFYYNGKVVVNTLGSVTEYNLSTGAKNEYEADDYVFPEIKTRLYIETGDVLRIVQGTEEYFMTLAELCESSSQMSVLYELSKEQCYPGLDEHRFLFSIVYYNAEPYLVFTPITKGGESFGALFKYEAGSRVFKYIGCTCTFDIPHYMYPIIVE